MDAKIYRCFIASPGDTKAERGICDQVISEINKLLGTKFNFRIETLKWETDTRPSFGDSSQGVINEQIGNTYDLFIGIMYKKFGTTTKHAGSGTEEEFNNAYTRFMNKESLQIMFYFNVEEAGINEIDPEELGKVNSFRKKIESLNGYYSQYNGSSDFETQLRKHLNEYFLSLSNTSVEKTDVDTVLNILKSRLDKALCTFSDQPIIWVDPIISNTNEISVDPNENYTKRINIDDIIDNPHMSIVNAPPQFGLTCLSHYLVKEAWKKVICGCTLMHL